MGLSFSDLQPEVKYFELENGDEIPFKHQLSFSLDDGVAFGELMGELPKKARRVEKANDTKAKKAARVSYRDTLRRLIAFLLPDMPSAELEVFSVEQLNRIWLYWVDNCTSKKK